MKLGIYYLRPAPGFVFSVSIKVGREPQVMSAQIGFCRAAIFVGAYVMLVGNFKRWSDATLAVLRAEPVNVGILLREGLTLISVQEAQWMGGCGCETT